MKYEDYLEEALQKVFEPEVKCLEGFKKMLISRMKKLKEIFQTLPDSEELCKFLEEQSCNVEQLEKHWSSAQTCHLLQELLKSALERYVELYEALKGNENFNELLKEIEALEVKMIDTHTHYAHPKFDDTREALLETFPEQGIITVIEAAIGYESNFEILKLCEKYPYVYGATGIHPMFVETLDEEKFEKIESLLSHEKVLAVGETGLDYSKRNDTAFIEVQKKWLKRFIELALKHKLPLVIHCRDAYDDMIEIMSKYEFGNNPGIIHCFSGNAEHAKWFVDKGFFLGIGGKFLKNVDKNQELREIIKELPLESMVLETDAPYLKPDGVEGVCNTSLNLRYIVEELAKLKGVEQKVICDITLENAKRYMQRGSADNER